MAYPKTDARFCLILLHEIELRGSTTPEDMYPVLPPRFPELTNEDLARPIFPGSRHLWWPRVVRSAKQNMVNRGCIKPPPMPRGRGGVWELTQAGRKWHNDQWCGYDADYSSVEKP